MVREVRGRYSRGKIEPVEELELREGEEVTILIGPPPKSEEQEASSAFERAAGSWEGTLDFDQFLTELRASRKRQQRPPVDFKT